MKIFKQQHWHLLLLIPMLLFLNNYATIHPDSVAGSLWDISTSHWWKLAISIPIVHQFYVLVCWRIEFYYKSISTNFGENGYNLFKTGFAILIIARPISLTLLAFSNSKTFDLDTNLTYLITLLLCIPSTYLFYSVKKYFGIDRAFGEDHFKPEKYRNQELIKKGIFKYTSNGMYNYGFLALYIPGILLHSKAAILIAFFNHLYIWVHYYFTEAPDMKEIYTDTK